MAEEKTIVSRLSAEETQQLLRTVEMFEAITESQPDDYQSLEILKEAYNKLGRTQDGLRVSKKLASAYVKLGQMSQALLEYEGIHEEAPQDASITAALADLEAKLAPSQTATASPPADNSKPVVPPIAPAGTTLPLPGRGGVEDGDRALTNVLIAEKLVTPQAMEPLLQRVKAARLSGIEKGQGLTLVQLLVNEQIAKLDDLLTVIVDKSGLPYLPLSAYDVDRDIACLLPKDLCWQQCLLPFDLISRSLLIATSNPFNQRVHDQIQSMLDYNLFWYVAAPADILAALRRAHGMDSARPQAKT